MESVFHEVRTHLVFKKGPIYESVMNIHDKDVKRRVYIFNANSFYNKTTAKLRKKYLRRNKNDNAPLFPKDSKTYKEKNLLYSLPENVQYMIFKLSFDNVMKELKELKYQERSLSRIIKSTIRGNRDSTDVYKVGVRDGIMNTVESRTVKVFMKLKWHTNKWYNEIHLYGNGRLNYARTRRLVVRNKILTVCYSTMCIGTMKVPDLKWLCRENRLKMSGRRIQLIQRLQAL